MSRVPLVEIRSVLIPLLRNFLLIPNVVVAEVMNYSQPEIRQEAPDWFLGDIAWRGTSVPIVSMEGLMGDEIVEPGYRSRMIILNTINGESLLPHIGIVAHAIPSLVRVTSESIESPSLPVNQNGLIKQVVIVGDKEVYIPDLDELEKLVLGYMAAE